MGVPFAHQGRSAQGLDCLGLLIVAAQEAGVTFDGKDALTLEVPLYGTRPDTRLLKQKLDGYLCPIATAQVREGDMVLLKVEGSPQHLALISDYPFAGEYGMIHAYAPARKVVEHRYDTHWRRETYAAYRLKD
ncbi:MAG: NlpC/P60 family protein [Pseudomonadota bacterium]